MSEYTGKIIKKKFLTPRIGTVTLKLDRAMDFKPGQFCNVSIPGNPKKLMRPYSITSIPGNQMIEFYIKSDPEGSVAKHILDMKEGEVLNLKGPYGNFFLREGGQDVYFIAGGSGIAPLMSMVRHMKNFKDERAIKFVHGASYPQELGYHDELKILSGDNDSFKYYPTVSRESTEWVGLKGRAEDLLNKLDNTRADVYICGPPPMVINIAKILKDKGFDEERIFTERYY